jgi:osmotically-inducible protein OsmY
MRLRYIGLVAAGAGVVTLFLAVSHPENMLAAMAFSSALGVGNPNAANAKLEDAVRAALATDEKLRHAQLQVQADVTKNQVTLSGAVESEAARMRAIELAKTAQVGVTVDDKITVRKSAR